MPRSHARLTGTPALAVVLVGSLLWWAARWHASALVGAATLPSSGSSRLLYVFHAVDCENYRAMARGAARVATATGIATEGVIFDAPASAQDFQILRERLGLAFAVRTDTNREVERAMLRLGLTRTPALLLVDAQGIVRLVAPPTASEGVMDELVASASRYARLLVPEDTDGANP